MCASNVNGVITVKCVQCKELDLTIRRSVADRDAIHVSGKPNNYAWYCSRCAEQYVNSMRWKTPKRKKSN